MNYRKINFDRELDRGRVCYEEKVGRWWQNQALNRPHQAAYRRIAGFVREAAPKSTGLIVDYACGSGQFLTRLPRRFPRSRFLGLDGSAYMLGLARQRLARLGKDALDRTTLRHSSLPSFSLPRGRADVVVFAFPNVVLSAWQSRELRAFRLRHRGNLEAARYLAAAREPDPEDETEEMDEETLFENLLDDDLVARNLRMLLKPGGLCIRAEYCNSHRREFTPLVRRRKAFEEGSLIWSVNGKATKPYFRLVRSRYVRSKVIEDVYHQTRDDEDKLGGYAITLLKAL